MRLRVGEGLELVELGGRLRFGEGLELVELGGETEGWGGVRFS